MPAKTVRAHFDGERILLDEPCEIQPGTELLVTVLPSASEGRRESWRGRSVSELREGPEDGQNVISASTGEPVATRIESTAMPGPPFEMLDCGIRFRGGEDGELPEIEWDRLMDAYKYTTGLQRAMKRARKWVAGDILLYIDAMVEAGKWPAARFTEFRTSLGYKNPKQIERLMAVSRTFGWPDRPQEYRRTPPLTHTHHFLVEGIDDIARRTDLLDIAASKRWTVDRLRYLLYRHEKHGYGQVVSFPKKRAFGK
jgi:hypothetical protein